MSYNSAPRFKSGKGKSVRIDKIRAQEKKVIKAKINHFGGIILTISLFILSVTLLSGFFVYKKLSQSFVSAQTYGSYNSDVETFSYIVVDSFKSDPIELKKINFIVLDKTSNKSVRFDVPLDIEFNLPGKFSDMTLKNTFALGALDSEDKLDGGVSYLNLTIFKMFGMPVDNYILVEQSLSDEVDSLLYDGKSVFPFGGLSLAKMKSSFHTDFSFRNFYQTQKFLSSLSKESFISITPSNEQISDTFFIDDKFRDLTLSSSVANDRKTVAVLNGTDLSGVASLGSRVIKNMGGRVVSIENALDKYDNSILIVDDPNSVTASYIKKAFNIKNVYTKEEAPFIKESTVDRADITLILGFDIANKMY